MIEVPDRWPLEALPDVVEVLDRLRVPVNATERAKRQGTVPYYGATGVAGTIDTHIFNEPLVLLGEDGVQFFDPLARKAYLIDGPAWVNNHAHVLRPHASLDRRFLCHWLNATDYTGLATGTTRLKLTQRAMKKLTVPLPPLAEQRAIVETIERMLSLVDAASAELDRAVGRLAAFREASLHAAVYGRVAAAGSLEKAAKQWPRRGEGVILPTAPPDVMLPAGWAWASLDQIAEVQSGAAKSMKLNRAEGCVERPYLSVANVQRGRLELDGVGTMWVKSSKLDAITLQPGDVLFNEGGDKDKLGRGWVWEGQVGNCVHQNHVFRARLLTDAVLPKWLSHWGNVFGRWWFYERGSQTTGIASINKGVLRSLPVAVPPVEVQESLLAEIDKTASVVTAVEKSVAAGRQRAGVLRRSILQAAFGGRLTRDAQDAQSLDDLQEAIA